MYEYIKTTILNQFKDLDWYKLLIQIPCLQNAENWNWTTSFNTKQNICSWVFSAALAMTETSLKLQCVSKQNDVMWKKGTMQILKQVGKVEGKINR